MLFTGFPIVLAILPCDSLLNKFVFFQVQNVIELTVKLEIRFGNGVVAYKFFPIIDASRRA